MSDSNLPGELRPGDATCWFCTGEACAQYHQFGERCECDVIARHGERSCSDIAPDFDESESTNAS